MEMMKKIAKQKDISGTLSAKNNQVFLIFPQDTHI